MRSKRETTKREKSYRGERRSRLLVLQESNTVSLLDYCNCPAREKHPNQATFLDASGKDGNAQYVVDHKTEETHLGGTAVVELDGTLLELGFFVKRVPAKVEVSVSEVTREFSSGDVLQVQQRKAQN